MTTTRELTGAPGLAGLYARALGGGLLAAVPRPPGAGLLPGLGAPPRELPDTGLVLADARLDRAALAAYDEVCGFRLGDRLPPTYLHVAAFPLAMSLMTGGDFPFPLLGLVHIANRIHQVRPVDVAERPTLRVHAADLRPHDKGRQFDVVATASVAGEVVWTGVSTYLRRGGSSEGGSGGSGGGSSSSSSGGGRSDRPAPDLPKGPGATWSVPGDIGLRYAAVSGDRNPIHLSPLSARLFGFPKAIAHGMWTAARALAALEGRLPAELTADVRFGRPLLLPASVDFLAHPRDGGWAVAVRDRRSGAPHLSGTVTPGAS